MMIAINRSVQLMPSATLCRSVHGDCDLGEYCNGLSEFCPSDAYRPDGTVCYTSSVKTVLNYINAKCEVHTVRCCYWTVIVFVYMRCQIVNCFCP